MLPAAAAAHLRQRGHDAISVHDVDLAGVEDDQVFAYAVKDQRVGVTENFGDYARIIDQRLSRDEPCVPICLCAKPISREAVGGRLTWRPTSIHGRLSTPNPTSARTGHRSRLP